MQKKKRIISLLLALFMVLALWAPTSVNAANYKPRTSLPSDARSTMVYYGSQNPYGQYWKIGNCTWYAFGRAWENLGYYPSDLIFQCNADGWYSANKAKYDSGKGGYPYSANPNAPALGAIVCYGNGGKCHVAVVEEIYGNGSQILVAESGYGYWYFHTQTISVSDLARRGFSGYIYVLKNGPSNDYHPII